MSRPAIGHLSPASLAMMGQLIGLLQDAFRTDNELTIPVSGPGLGRIEICFVNLDEPGDKVIVCQNGLFAPKNQIGQDCPLANVLVEHYGIQNQRRSLMRGAAW